MGIIRRAGIAAAAAAAPLGLAYRFALVYRARAGYPRRHPPLVTPADLGLPFETDDRRVRRPSPCRPGSSRPAAAQPGPGRRPRPRLGIGARPDAAECAVFLHAAGFHCLTLDVRGHGANPAEALPLSAGRVRRGCAGRRSGR